MLECRSGEYLNPSLTFLPHPFGRQTALRRMPQRVAGKIMRIVFIAAAALLASACAATPGGDGSKRVLFDQEPKEAGKKETLKSATELCAREKRRADLVAERKRTPWKSDRRVRFQCA